VRHGETGATESRETRMHPTGDPNRIGDCGDLSPNSAIQEEFHHAIRIVDPFRPRASRFPIRRIEAHAISSSSRTPRPLFGNCATLDRWLANPENVIAGQKMGYSVSEAADRANLIAYLKSQSRH
jgi:hypothetical protein